MEPTSPALKVLDLAATQVQDVLHKAEQSLSLLQQNLQQVSTQKIALSAQLSMLNELKTRIAEDEAAAQKPEKGTPLE